MIALSLACASLLAGQERSAARPLTLSCRDVADQIEIAVEASSDRAVTAAYRLVLQSGGNTINQSGRAQIKPHQHQQLAVLRTTRGPGEIRVTLEVTPDTGKPYVLRGTAPATGDDAASRR